MKNRYIDTGYVPCACGCKEPAEQVFKGVFIAGTNPMTHYKRYLQKKEMFDLQANSKLEQFAQEPTPSKLWEDNRR